MALSNPTQIKNTLTCMEKKLPQDLKTPSIATCSGQKEQIKVMA
jgi:hypothetical protein